MAARILIVDDDIDLLNSVKLALKDSASVIKTVQNAREAYELLSQETYHLIVCDIMMPELTGLEFLAELRMKGHEFPVIFISAFNLADNVLQALQLGAADFIAKPFDNKQLREKVEKFIEIGRRIERNRNIGPAGNQSEVEKNKKVINLLQLANALKNKMK